MYMSKGKRLISTVTSGSKVYLSIEEFRVPTPQPDEVLIGIAASPINPSDLGVLLGGADASTVTTSEHGLTLSLPDGAIDGLRGRVDQPMPVGNEGSGVVIEAGADEEAQALKGKVVAVLAGGMYATHRIVKSRDCLLLEDGTRAIDAASCFVNPLTALGMTESMRLEGHSALIHTAAASNLGQMLNRICIDDQIELVNIVRRDEHVELLRSQGAAYVVNSSSPHFRKDLVDALKKTGATIAFDAIGGGQQVDALLECMEKAVSRGAGFSRYCSDTHKQVYVYGGLDRSPTPLTRSYGMSWGVGGWLLTPFLGRIGLDGLMRLRDRVTAEISTTFASHYAEAISLDEMLDPEVARRYAVPTTGEKRLVVPGGAS